MTEKPEIFGESRPFTLIHAEDLPEVTRFLAQRAVPSILTPSGPSLFKLQFTALTGRQARALMNTLIGNESPSPEFPLDHPHKTPPRVPEHIPRPHSRSSETRP